ncbi:class I SAM-dependent methyltransferase [Streptomyces pseudovenezuelae]|uniref:SAM-dependent methyltransferase n=1 Tax=Streptomyces pseudovenezuelae TaxID=67350 RepID=A0ABT6LA15_9ACTN|nr:class I SAM-dependent methyltransferase [Streptomyces pseudovenezuelae]MDH6213152.1 SAM-dependent methyltransferase [Streptomyces pseudovenezuelae]
MFGHDLADVYELVYRARGKDWDTEATDIARLIRDQLPAADSLLDVACGTGAHLETFAGLFAHTEGLELSSAMLARAAVRLPELPLHQGDMRAFDVGRAFDAVVCLFTAIGYLPTLPDLRAAVATMARHLNPGGVLVVEPWWFPDRFLDGYVAGDLASDEHRTVARMSHSTRQDRTTRMEVRFLVGEAGGIREFTEIDLLTLFTEEEYLAAFADAGCPAEYIRSEWTARGLFVARRR